MALREELALVLGEQDVRSLSDPFHEETILVTRRRAGRSELTKLSAHVVPGFEVVVHGPSLDCLLRTSQPGDLVL